MAVKSVQLAVIIGWIIFQEVISIRGFRIDVLVGRYHDAVFVAIGLFILLQILIRISVCQRGRPLPLSLVVVVTIIITICAAFICGSDISKYRTRQKILHELVLTLFFVCSCLTFLPLTNARNIDVTKAQSFGSAAFATLIFSILIMFVVGILEQGKIMLDFKMLPESWIPVLLTAEFIIMILILEIRLALHGKLCDLTEHDWLFLAMLL